MTAKEISQCDESQRTIGGWLKEIAYQLATLNESEPEPILGIPIAPPTPVKRGPGRPPKQA